MEDLLRSSISVYSSIRDALVDVIEFSRPTHQCFANYAGTQMHYFSERCQSMNILLMDWKLWDCDILFRSALECATRYLFVCVASPEERDSRVKEYMVDLDEIESIHRTEKLRIASSNAHDASSAMLLSGAALTPDEEEVLRARWPRQKRKALQQRWSFSEIVRTLKLVNETSLDLRLYGSLLHSYSLSSHLIHADRTAITLMHDRATRGHEERALLERAHFARLAVEQTSILFLCWRATEFAVGRNKKRPEVVQQLLSLHTQADVYHREFAESQMDLYKER